MERANAKLESLDVDQAVAAMTSEERGNMLVELWRAAFQGHCATNDETVAVFGRWWLDDDGDEAGNAPRVLLAPLSSRPMSLEVLNQLRQKFGDDLTMVSLDALPPAPPPPPTSSPDVDAVSDSTPKNPRGTQERQ